MEGSCKQTDINKVASAYDHLGQLSTESLIRRASPKALIDEASALSNSEKRRNTIL